MTLNEIPQEQTTDFPEGVNEVVYPTELEMDAFIYGLCYADDIDVECSEPFVRDGRQVVRVRVGDFGDSE